MVDFELVAASFVNYIVAMFLPFVDAVSDHVDLLLYF